MMKMNVKILVAVAVAVIATVLLFGCSKDAGNPDKADMVIRNGRIYTSNPANKWAEAVAVKDELICYVGDNNGIQQYIGPGTKVIDAGDKMVVPGFVDNHCHVLWMGALHGIMANVYYLPSLEEMSNVIKEYARNHPEDPFIMAIGWTQELFPEGLPDAAEADKILSDRPLFLWSGGGHTGWVNTKALELMQERNPDAFELLTPEYNEATGEPTGILLNFQRFNPMDFFSTEEMGADLAQRMFGGMSASLELAMSYGVTTLNDVQIYDSFIPKILKFYEQGGLENVRVRGSYYIDPNALEDEADLKKRLEEWKNLQGQYNKSHLFMGGSVKMYMDGVIGTYTSFLLEPYSNKPGYVREAYWSLDDFKRIMEIVDGMGLQACVHGVGDAATRRIIDGCEHAQKVNGVRDSRHRIEHNELIVQEDIERMAKFGVYAAMQPSHFYGGDKLAEDAIGIERLKRMMPWKSLKDAGVEMSAGSDWVAAPFNPMFGLLFGATRINYLGNTDWGPEQKLTLEDVLIDYTMGSAKAMMLEDKVGSIEVGKYGDFAIFSVDLLDISTWGIDLSSPIEPDDLDGKVIMTIVGGKVVYEKKKDR